MPYSLNIVCLDPIALLFWLFSAIISRFIYVKKMLFGLFGKKNKEDALIEAAKSASLVSEKTPNEQVSETLVPNTFPIEELKRPDPVKEETSVESSYAEEEIAAPLQDLEIPKAQPLISKAVEVEVKDPKVVVKAGATPSIEQKVSSKPSGLMSFIKSFSFAGLKKKPEVAETSNVKTKPEVSAQPVVPVNSTVKSNAFKISLPASYSEDTKNALMGRLLKTAVFVLVSLSLVVTNFFIEQHFVKGEELSNPGFKSLSYSEENIIPDRGIIRFAPESEFGFSNAVEVSPIEATKGYLLNVASGKFWANFTASNANVNFVVGEKIVIIPSHASFDFEFDGEKLVLSVFDGDVYVGLLDEGLSVTEPVDPYSELFLNILLVPRDSQVTVPLKKIGVKLSDLLYLKLIKEFKYSVIPKAIEDSQWAKDNQLKDFKFFEGIKQDFVSHIILRGDTINDSKVGQFVFWAEENLTFVPFKKRKMIFEHLFAYLNDAIFYANEGDEVLSSASWDEFNSYYQNVPASVSDSEDYFKRFDVYVDQLSVFGPSDVQYQMFKNMAEKKFFEGRDAYEVLNLFWADVYEGLNADEVMAEQALNNYYSYFKSLSKSGTGSAFYKDFISFQNQLFDNLFLRYPVFYRDGYFEMKNQMEEILLSLYVDDPLYNELSQALISNKIDFLKRMMKFFFDEKISISDAKEILSRLVEEVNKLMPKDDSGVAVIDLFESRLNDIGDFWGYLSSPQYNLSKTYGSTHEERYKFYLQEKDKIWNFVNLQEDLLGETLKKVTVEDVEAEMNAVFAEFPEITNHEFGEIEDVEQRYVSVKGVVGGYSFEASFDRDNSSLSDVYVYGKLVSDSPLKIGNLLSVLQEKFADLVDEGAQVGDDYTIESVAQRTARVYIAKIIGEYGFEITLDNVSLVDELNALYRVENVVFKEKESVVLTFDFLMNGETATNLLLTIKGTPVLLDGKFTLEELRNVALAEGDLSKVDGSESDASNDSSGSGEALLR